MDTLTREEMQRRLVAVATADPRVVGLLISGSPSEGRADRWSDVDAELFLRDADCGAFTADWIPWAGRLGGLLLAYVGGIGHPWAVYAAAPAPLRVDFSFIPESEIPGVRAWPIAPLSVESIVFYDATGGRLRALVAERVGRSLSPDDPAVAYGAVCGDFWYYVLRTWGRIARADQWGARQDLHSIVLNLLAALL